MGTKNTLDQGLSKGYLDFYSTDTEDLAARRTVLARKATALLGGRKSDAEIPDEIKEKLRKLLDLIKSMDAELERRSEDVDALATEFDITLTADELQGGGPDSSKARYGAPSAKGRTHLTRAGLKTAGQAVVARAFTASGRKALSLTGASGVAVVAPGLRPLGRPESILDVIEAQATPTPNFRFLQQTARANAAGVVAKGAVKPESTYGLTTVDRSLQIVAHISEAIHEYDLQDVPALTQFVQAELEYGLAMAVENQVINGTGAAGQLHGFAGTSGIQVQAFGDDLLTTARRSVTKLENLGYRGRVFVLSPSAWETAELAVSAGSGEFVNATAPVNRAEQKLWGVPVVISTQLPAKSGYLIGEDSVLLYSDPGAAIRVEWDRSSDDFTRNQVRCRLEGRFEVAVTRPEAIVRVGTEAA